MSPFFIGVIALRTVAVAGQLKTDLYKHLVRCIGIMWADRKACHILRYRWHGGCRYLVSPGSARGLHNAA